MNPEAYDECLRFLCFIVLVQMARRVVTIFTNIIRTMKQKSLLAAMLMAASALCLTACGEESGLTPEPTPTPTPTPNEKVQIPINIAVGTWTRATDAAYEANDQVGIYVVNYNGSTAGTLAASGNHVDNKQFTYDGSKWTSASEVYWKDQTTKADFYCYYPYASTVDISAYSFGVQADQSTEANYKKSDFLWGKSSGVAPTASAVPITTNHIFSNMLIYLEAGDGFTAETLAAATKSIKIANVKTQATINLSTGVATATGTAGTVTPRNMGDYYRALIVPQTIADGTSLISVTVDGVEYSLDKGFTFKANTQHKFTVTVSKTSSGVNIGIGGWETDDTDNGGSAE